MGRPAWTQWPCLAQAAVLIAIGSWRGGANAGCRWDGRSPHAICRTPPDKETPLWAPDEAPISYWSSQETSPDRALAVDYTGGIGVLPIGVEGLGVGFRCVKPVPAG